jgi:YesN/AraC family two-component response regulator
MVEVFKGYANLVKKHSISKYSPAVQRTIITVDADLTADLSLSALAEKNNVSAGYLSAVFKKETGETLTDFVNMRRIKNAKKLLMHGSLRKYSHIIIYNYIITII